MGHRQGANSRNDPALATRAYNTTMTSSPADSAAIAAPPKRRWYQFSLRTVLIVMTLLCLGPGGYVAYEQNKAREQKRAVGAILKLGGTVDYGETVFVRPRMMRLVLGDETFGNVNHVNLNPVIYYDVGSSSAQENHSISDGDLRYLRSFPRLQYLSLNRCGQITDAGLADLAGMSSLEEIYLDHTQVTDVGLRHLARIPGLEHLWLNDTRVSDAGLVQLTELTKLRRLYLHNTLVTPQGVRELQKALPNCRITR